MAAPVERLGDIKLSANWMAACGSPGQDAALFDAVRAVGMELCPALGIGIPVGKDSMSMRTTWADDDGQRDGAAKQVVAPVSLIVSAFAPVRDVRHAGRRSCGAASRARCCSSTSAPAGIASARRSSRR